MTITTPAHSPILIVGGGLGGVSAALAAARLGVAVVLTEETEWLGGQLTAQAVPSDEHPWIEQGVTSSSYADLRTRVRDYYRRNYPLTDAARQIDELNPGLGNVSRLCAEPLAAVAAIDEMLAGVRSAGLVTVRHRLRPLSASVDGDRVSGVTFLDLDTGEPTHLTADIVIDATELGDLLELAQVEHVVGSESSLETGERFAPDVADWRDQQAVTWCFPLEFRPGESHVVDRPASYDHWLTHVDPFWPGPQLSWFKIDIHSNRGRENRIFEVDMDEPRGADLWHFRRIRARTQFDPNVIATDISLVNWPNTDYWEAPLVGPGIGETERQWALQRARELSLSYLHWMQTEAPRHDGGVGYPELRLRPDITGTKDGLAKQVYVRESRRIRALFTVVEQHVAVVDRPEGDGAARFADSVGIGHYNIDLHPSAAGMNYVNLECYPFQIPLGALVPVRVRNLIPAAKNIGTTHLTNGCYRLHPVEWSIGEAAGALAAQCIAERTEPHAVAESPRLVGDLQRTLEQKLGAPVAWPEQIRRTRPSQAVGRTPLYPLPEDRGPRAVVR
ncbi:FAD-dependent oxidoreductase [Leifsonia sp. H3M29-4]|uniref:FAD-dependent oxidoreductase n=1 Tax=Salinibacterium metalliresistens TaxID=3031321 RepID=UPI0023DBA021|nr:FAD-dependent oxidoreductase [Salinibacterium metalliresistens]MDF1477979.1 FAD-dependent oxidoreductase [Salinibacterium metalliresistens]